MFAFLLSAGVPQPAESQTYQVIHNFTGEGSDGATPYGGPTLDSSGNVFGTTNLGGSNADGTVYELSPNGSSWTFNTIYSFAGGADGAAPGFGSLLIRHDCSLFGTTEAGGGALGTAFKIRPRGNPCHKPDFTWQEKVLHRFGRGEDGGQPTNGVTFDRSANFYGITNLGGAYNNGAVFEVAHSGGFWTETLIYSFTGGDDGGTPVAGVTFDDAGNLYGTTSFGGLYGSGVVYGLSPSVSGWSETVLYNFQGLSDGEFPVGGVIVDHTGNLYGSTFLGGDNGGGTVYQLSPSGGGWTLTTLYSFSTYYGPYNKLTLDAHGNLYGAANGAGANGLGSVFKLAPGISGWTFTDLYDFTGGNDGGQPYGSVAVDASGNIFGTNVVGGSNNQGVVFEITP
jgi:uncharacterized repeat protein (TIGR03803 family)